MVLATQCSYSREETYFHTVKLIHKMTMINCVLKTLNLSDVYDRRELFEFGRIPEVAAIKFSVVAISMPVECLTSHVKKRKSDYSKSTDCHFPSLETIMISSIVELLCV